MFYALDPAFMRTFIEAVEKACRTPSSWVDLHKVLGELYRPPRVRFFTSGRQFSLLDAGDGGVELTADKLPTDDEKAALFKAFAIRFPACQFLPNETKLFLHADLLEQEHPELGLDSSREWDLLRNQLLAPDYLPEEFLFLAGDPDNSSASCLTREEAAEIVEQEKAEHLLERRVIGYGNDGPAILGLLQLAASQGWYVWFHEVS
jgi:hypothetical protein